MKWWYFLTDSSGMTSNTRIKAKDWQGPSLSLWIIRLLKKTPIHGMPRNEWMNKYGTDNFGIQTCYYWKWSDNWPRQKPKKVLARPLRWCPVSLLPVMRNSLKMIPKCVLNSKISLFISKSLVCFVQWKGISSINSSNMATTFFNIYSKKCITYINPLEYVQNKIQSLFILVISP